MAEDKKILFELKVKTDAAKSAMKETEVQIQKLIQSFKTLEQGSKKYEAAQAKLAVLQNKFASSANKYASALTAQKQVNSGLSNSLTGVSRASGGAATSVLELGRVVSDAPYGIRGMANNISQLASNMLFTAQQVDAATGKVIGFGGVLRQMGQTFLGPLGVLFAIQSVISAFDYFYGATKKAEEGVEDLTESIEKEVEILSLYKEAIDQSNDSLEIQNGIVTSLGLRNKELSKILSETTGSYEDRITATLEFIKSKELESEVLQRTTKVEEAIRKRKELGITSEEEALDKLKLAEKLLSDARKNATKDDNIMINILSKDVKNLEDIVENYSDLVDDLEFIFKNGGADSLIENSIKDFESQKKALEEFRNSAAVTKQQYDLVGKSIDALQVKINALKGSKKKPPGSEDREQIEGIFGEMSDGTTVQDTEKQRGKYSELFLEKFGITNEENMLKMEQAMDFHRSILANETLFELERTNTAKKGAKERLDTQLKYMEAVGGGLQALSEIAGQETAAGKALAVAGATIDTYAAVTGILANTAKTPLGGVPGYAIAQAVTAGLFGLANVKKIISTSVPGGGGGVGGSAGSVPSGRTFDFNLVGSTGVNQLAQTVGGQVSQPIKAYVVGSEITNQQAFDNQIQGQATIG